MIINRPINNREPRLGDQVVLAEGPDQGTSGVFLRLRDDIHWAEIKELNSMVRYHLAKRLQRSALTCPGQPYQARPGDGIAGPNHCLNLACARQGTGITLEEITRFTKIGLRFLQAIEAEDFGKLPGGVYSTSYIRQYAQAIGYDESVVLDHYYGQMGLEPTTETAPSQGRLARGRLRGDDALRSFFEHVAAGRRNQHSAQSHAPA